MTLSGDVLIRLYVRIFIAKIASDNIEQVPTLSSIVLTTKYENQVKISHMKTGKRTSQFNRFIKPIVKILKQSGGYGLSSEVTDNVVEIMKIPENEPAETLKNGESRIRKQVSLPRMYLVNSGYIDSSVRGTWKLTDKGLSFN